MGETTEKPMTGMVTRKTEGTLDVGTFSEAVRLSQILARSGLVPAALRGKPDDVLLVMLTGRSLGIDSVTALRQIHIIKDRTAPDAALLRALAQRRLDCEYLTLLEDGSQGRATWETKRRGQPKPIRITWTLDMAKRAGLAGKDNWKNYPEAMLRARASAELVRAVYPEVTAGLYTLEEIQDLPLEATAEWVADPILQPAPKPPASPESDGPPMTAGQMGQLTALETHLGMPVVNEIMGKCGIKTRRMSEQEAALLIDTLTAEAEARAKQPAQPEPVKSPGDVPADQGPPAGAWEAGRE